MTDPELYRRLDGLTELHAWAHCDALGEVIAHGGPAPASLAGVAPTLLLQATEIGRDLGLGVLHELELHGRVHLMCLPREGGALLVETASRGALSPVSQLLAETV